MYNSFETKKERGKRKRKMEKKQINKPSRNHRNTNLISNINIKKPRKKDTMTGAD